MKKAKLFLENFIVYGLIGAMGYIIPFIMTPIVTRMIPDAASYGLSDITGTLVSFASYIAIMGLYDAMFRLFFDTEDETYKKSICSTAFTFLIFTSVLVSLLMVIFRYPLAKRFLEDGSRHYIVIIAAVTTLFGATNTIVSAPTRMQNKRKVYMVMNIVIPVVSYLVAIPLLLRGQYEIALPVSAAITGCVNEVVFFILNRKWFDVKLFDFDKLKTLLKLGIPLMPNFLMYWVFGSCDRLMISNFLGLWYSGVYAAGAKLALASQLIYTGFAGGWQFFAFSTMNEDNQVESNSRIFDYLAAISFISATYVFALTKPINQWFYNGDYELGYIVTPYLFLAPLLQMMYQTIVNQFLIVKKTWPGIFALAFGAVFNIVLNMKLIPILGIEGAAIATLLGYVVVLIITIIILLYMKLMVLSWRFIVSLLVEVIYVLGWRFSFGENIVVSVLLALLATILIVVIYLKDLLRLRNDKNA